MRQNNYGMEAFNLRLTVLRMIRKLPWLAGFILLGVLLMGGGYYVKNVMLQKEVNYVATSTFHVEYAVESEAQIGTVYINETSWNTYIHSDVFLDAVQARFPESDREMLSTMLQAYLASDLRVPSVKVTGSDPAQCVLVAQAVEAAMTEDVPKDLREIEAVTVADFAREAEVVEPDVRVGRAFVLSAVLSVFFVVVIFLLRETWANAIWLPASLWKRYGLKTVGTMESKELSENIKYFFSEKKKVAVCPVSEDINPVAVLEALKDTCGEETFREWFSVPAPLLCPEVCRQLREADGILLVVGAGAHAGCKLEPVLEYLEQQDCAVTGAVLADADERLIRAYYLGGAVDKRDGV